MKKFILAFACLFVSSQLMAQSQGPNDPAIGAVSASGCLACPGSIWNNEMDVCKSDNKHADVSLEQAGFCFQSSCYYSRGLIGADFGFSIPFNASITGIMVEIQKHAANKNCIVDKNLQLTVYTNVTGTNLALSGNWPTINTYFTYGGSGNLWGTSLTDTDINDPSFGVFFQAENTDGNTQDCYVDHMRTTIYYTTTTGIASSQSSDGSMKAWSNGAGRLNVSCPVKKETSNVMLSVISATGQIVYSSAIATLAKGNFDTELNVGALAKGIYLVRLSSAAGVQTTKVVVGN